MSMVSVHAGVDADFAQDVLGELYAYRRKRLGVAWALWAVLGWLGAHRFYLERPATGLAMVVTGGGVLLWWISDAWRLRRMVEAYNAEQARREREGLPPLELGFMPPLSDDVLSRPPAWTEKWRARTTGKRVVRLTGDVLVLIAAGSALGAMAGSVEGGAEAAFAVGALILVTMMGGHVGRLNEIPLAGSLVRWSHRLRLFYYYNRPGSPPALLLRPVTGLLMAPFRRKERAEAALYLEVGAVFTAIFLTFDLLQDVGGPLIQSGLGALSPFRLIGLWVQEAFMTFLVTYAFAAPIGAVLTLYLLTSRTNRLPRVLGGVALFFIAKGAGLI